MKIVQIVNTLSAADGGPARHALDLAVAFGRYHSIESELYWIRGAASESILPDSWREGAAPVKVSKVKGLVNLAEILAGADAVLVNGYYLLWTLPVVLAARAMHVPAVSIPHGSLTSRQQRFSVGKKRVFDATLGWIVRNAIAGFITGSEIEARDLTAKFPNVCARVGGAGTQIPDVEVEDLPWGVPLKILSLSRIAPKKRHDLMICAMRELKERGIWARLDIVGSGPASLTSKLMGQVKELELEDHVVFHGQKNGAAKLAFYNEADIYLLPSDDENFGISLAEALAHGVPSIASKAVASSELMDELAGRILERPSPAGIATAIQELVTLDRKALRLAAMQCAKANYSWEAVSIRWVEELGNLGVRGCDH